MQRPPSPSPLWRPKRASDSVSFAVSGILHAFRSQRHIRYHFYISILVLLAGVVWRLERVELLLLFFSIALVLITELLNTAIEAAVDLVTTTYHPLAKLAKDIAAGAVLVAAFAAAAVGVVLFLTPDRLARVAAASAAKRSEMELLVIASAVLLALVLVFKVRGNRGTFLHGGVVSGHAAIGFALCTVIVLADPSPFVWLAALLLALLTAQSRVEAGVHSVREVFMGALLGVSVAVLVFYLVPRVGGSL